MSAVSLLHLISSEMNKMGSAERRVADFVRSKPSDVVNMSMAAIAEASNVSDPTIVRFFRRFGFNGLNDFKMRLAQDLVPQAPFAYEPIRSDDTASEVVRKTCHNSINAVQRALQDFNIDEIEKCTQVLVDAHWIGIVAAGMSEIAALDAEHKFSRLGLRCASIVRPSRQRALVQTTREGDALLIFSQSGATRRLVEVSQDARAKGAVTIAVTAPDSPLAEVSTQCIAIKPYERMEAMTPLASRLNHQLLVNMLVSTISIASGSEFPDQLPALDSWVTEKL